MSIPDLMTKNAHEYARLMEELLTKVGEGIKSFILLRSEIEEARKRVARAELDIQRKPSTGKDVSIQGQGQSDVEVLRKDDPIQGLKNVTGTAIVAKTGAEAIQQGKDNQAKTDSILYLRDNLEPGVPVQLKDGATVTSTIVSNGIVEIEVEKDGQKQSIGKVSETGIVAVNPSYSNERLEIIQELIDSKIIEQSTEEPQVNQATQVTQATQATQATPIAAVENEATSIQTQSILTEVTKTDLNNLQAYLYSDEHRMKNPNAYLTKDMANKKMRPHQQKYMQKARAKHGSHITTTDRILDTDRYEVDLAPEDVEKISVANEWAAREEAKEKRLQKEQNSNISR
jgi:putative ubiquitin-RnfH superfamily antitoxin RatB of RatAB toxin-antitoxin module